jgi:uncharacterized protein YdaU (DUF1376 family)
VAREKSPAFQFYPKDLMSDPRVLAMTAEAFGVYWWLVSVCWLNQSLPDDVAACAAICRGKVSEKRFAGIWSAVRACFEADGDGNLRHRRLDRERVEQAESKKRRTDAARKRWDIEHPPDHALHQQSTCIAYAKQCSSSPSPSASASPTPVRESTDPPLHGKPLAYKPRIDVAWPGRPPVPGGLHAEFVMRLGGDESEARAKLLAWYPTVAAAWDGKPIGDDDFVFWKARFREWVGTTVKPAVTESPPAFDIEAMKRNIAAKDARLKGLRA